MTGLSNGGIVLASLIAVAAMGGAARSAAQDATRVGDPARGERIYARCIACHAIESNRTGPQHCGLFERRAGTAPGFSGYSKAMREARIVWNERTLDVFLQDPMKALPGTAMGYAGVKDAQERADLIAWLRQATVPGNTCSLEQ
jgi:cytochrome c